MLLVDCHASFIQGHSQGQWLTALPIQNATPLGAVLNLSAGREPPAAADQSAAKCGDGSPIDFVARWRSGRGGVSNTTHAGHCTAVCMPARRMQRLYSMYSL